MNFTTIATIGPSLLDTGRIAEIHVLGPCIFRINGAHVDAASASRMIGGIRDQVPDARIMLDLPGNKIRTSNLAEPIPLEKNREFELHEHEVNYGPFIKALRPGVMILADDANLTLEVVSVQGDAVRLRSHSTGRLRNNKGLHARHLDWDIPFLFKRDQDLIAVASEQRIAFISLSFVRNAADIQEARNCITRAGAYSPELFAKIETASAVRHLDEILASADHFNIDRGDLSSDIGLLNIPAVQERVVRQTRAAGKRIFLATQFLKNMEVHPVPLIAEVCALAEAIQAGVSGIQLSEETAVGQYPVECVKLVFDLHRQHTRNRKASRHRVGDTQQSRLLMSEPTPVFCGPTEGKNVLSACS